MLNTTLYTNVLGLLNKILPYIAIIMIVAAVIGLFFLFVWIVIKIIKSISFKFGYMQKISDGVIKYFKNKKAYIAEIKNGNKIFYLVDKNIHTNKIQKLIRENVFKINREIIPLYLMLSMEQKEELNKNPKAKGTKNNKTYKVISTKNYQILDVEFNGQLKFEDNFQEKLKKAIYKRSPEQPISGVIIHLKYSEIQSDQGTLKNEIKGLINCAYRLMEIYEVSVPMQIHFEINDEVKEKKYFMKEVINGLQINYQPGKAVSAKNLKNDIDFWYGNITRTIFEKISEVEALEEEDKYEHLSLFLNNLLSIKSCILETIESSNEAFWNEGFRPMMAGLIFNYKECNELQEFKDKESHHQSIGYIKPYHNHKLPLSLIDKTKNKTLMVSGVTVFSMIVLIMVVKNNIQAIESNSLIINKIYKEHNIKNNMINQYLDLNRLNYLLYDIQRVSEIKTTFILSPSSWRGEDKKMILEFLGKSFNEQIIKPKRLLNQKNEAVPDKVLDLNHEYTRVSSSEQLKSVDDLKEYIDRKNEIQQSKREFDGLRKSATYMELVNKIGIEHYDYKNINWSWEDKLPKHVIEGLMKESADIVPLQEDVENFNEGVSDYWKKINKDAFENSDFMNNINDINKILGALVTNKNFSHVELRELDSKFKKLERDLHSPYSVRITGTASNAIQFITPTMNYLATSKRIPLLKMSELNENYVKSREAARGKILSMTMNKGQYLFVLDKKTEVITTSPELKALIQSMNLLFNYGFMSHHPTESIKIEKDFLIQWNVNKFTEILELVNNYKTYMATHFQELDNAYKPVLSRIVKQQMELHQNHIVSQSVSKLIDNHRDGIKNSSLDYINHINARFENFTKIMDVLKKNKIEDTLTLEVKKALNQEALKYLRVYANAFSMNDPYKQLKNETIEWLVSTENKAIEKQFDNNFKNRALMAREYLKNNFIPYTKVLTEGLYGDEFQVENDKYLNFWKKIHENLNSFERGDTNNGVYEYDRYFSDLLKLDNQSACQEYIKSRKPPVTRPNYFSAALYELDNQFQRACFQRTAVDKVLLFNQYAKKYNSLFRDLKEDKFLKLNNDQTLRNFNHLLSEYSKLKDQKLIPNMSAKSSEMDYIRHMDNVSKLFMDNKDAHHENGIKESMPSVKSQFQLRHNKNDPSYHIIEWGIVVGDKQNISQDLKKLIEWKIGEKIEIRFRWAKNSPYTPILRNVGNSEFIKINQKEVIYTFSGEFSYFDLFHKYQNRSSRNDALELKFVIPVSHGERVTTANIILSITNQSGGGHVVPFMPVKAPILSMQN